MCTVGIVSIALQQAIILGRLTQLDDVANDAHDEEAHANCLGDAQELASVGCTSSVLSMQRSGRAYACYTA